MSDNVLYEVTEGIGVITLNRPDAMNSLDTETKVALRDASIAASGDQAVRVIVLTGTGRAFCVGQDLKEHAAALESGAGLAQTVDIHYNPMILALSEAPKPVIAAVNGVAAGAGAALAFAADLRIASEKASFNLAFANIGLTADSGASWTLPRLVGHAKALELLLLPETIPAAAAAELGMVNKVVAPEDLDETVMALARRMAAGPTTAYGAIKRSVSYGQSHSFFDTLNEERNLQDCCASSEDHLNAVRSFLKKETPTFTGD